MYLVIKVQGGEAKKEGAARAIERNLKSVCQLASILLSCVSEHPPPLLFSHCLHLPINCKPTFSLFLFMYQLNPAFYKSAYKAEGSADISELLLAPDTTLRTSYGPSHLTLTITLGGRWYGVYLRDEKR